VLKPLWLINTFSYFSLFSVSFLLVITLFIRTFSGFYPFPCSFFGWFILIYWLPSVLCDEPFSLWMAESNLFMFVFNCRIV